MSKDAEKGAHQEMLQARAELEAARLSKEDCEREHLRAEKLLEEELTAAGVRVKHLTGQLEDALASQRRLKASASEAHAVAERLQASHAQVRERALFGEWMPAGKGWQSCRVRAQRASVCPMKILCSAWCLGEPYAQEGRAGGEGAAGEAGGSARGVKAQPCRGRSASRARARAMRPRDDPLSPH